MKPDYTHGIKFKLHGEEICVAMNPETMKGQVVTTLSLIPKRFELKEIEDWDTCELVEEFPTNERA